MGTYRITITTPKIFDYEARDIEEAETFARQVKDAADEQFYAATGERDQAKLLSIEGNLSRKNGPPKRA